MKQGIFSCQIEKSSHVYLLSLFVARKYQKGGFLAFLAKPSTHIYFKIVANRLSLKKTLIQIYNQVI